MASFRGAARPLVSVIVPVHGSESFLPLCLDALSRQTCDPIEFLLVDDGSADRSLEICRRYAAADDRFRVKALGKNRGVSAARNWGIELALGEYIGFADADDLPAPDLYESLYHLCTRWDAPVSFCNYTRMAADGAHENRLPRISRLHESRGEGVLHGDEIFNAVLLPDSYGGFVWNKLFRRDLFQIPGGVRFDSACGFYEDRLFVTEALARVPAAAYTTRSLYRYRIHSTSVTAKRANWQLITGGMNARKRTIALLPPSCADFDKAVYVSMLSRYGFRALLSRDFALHARLRADFSEVRKEYIPAWRRLAGRFPLRTRLLVELVRLHFRK